MRICCPECRFEREIDVSSIPPTAAIATCPKCGRKFRFRDREPALSGPEAAPPRPARGAENAAAPGRKEKSARLPWFGFLRKQTGEKPESRAKDTVSPERPPKGAPWEHPEYYGLAGGFYHTLLGALFRSPEFFRNVRSPAPLTRPVVFYALLFVLESAFNRFWFVHSLPPMQELGSSPQGQALWENALQLISGPVFLLMMPFVAILQFFLLAGLYHLMIRLTQPDRADFPTVARVIAYSSAASVLSLVPFVGPVISLSWFAALSFVGCKFALNLPWSKTALALAPLFLLIFAVRFQLSSFALTSMF
jgi:hypothetical protein